MISVSDYFKAYSDHWGITDAHRANASELLTRVNHLLETAEMDHVRLALNPVTGTLISGDKNGGWRPQECPVGAPGSSHKTGEGVDIHDPDGELDDWLYNHVHLLVGFNLYAEHPSATRGWCHLTTRAPRSHNRFFYP